MNFPIQEEVRGSIPGFGALQRYKIDTLYLPYLAFSFSGDSARVGSKHVLIL